MPTRSMGAPDPTLRNSPIAESIAQEEPAPEIDERSLDSCYFNDERFHHGDYVRSGDQLLRCEHGVWTVAKPEVF